MLEGLKRCSKCLQWKDKHDDFYWSQGRPRGRCKPCTIKANSRYARRVEAWRMRPEDREGKRAYDRAYYAAHKDKFKEYRETFAKKYPDYHREYARKRKGM